MKKAGATTIEFISNLDTHDAQGEQLVDERAWDLRVLVHLANQWPHLALGELGDRIPKQLFVLIEDSQGLLERSVIVLNIHRVAPIRGTDQLCYFVIWLCMI